MMLRKKEVKYISEKNEGNRILRKKEGIHEKERKK